MTAESRSAYWRANLRLVIACLAVWFIVSYGFGILLVDVLDRITIGGFPLGFWFAQQGAIITFILLILIYCLVMNRLDRRHHEELDATGAARAKRRRVTRR